MADTTGDLYGALGRLVYSIVTRDTIGNQMSAFTDALTAAVTRVNQDFAHLRELLDQALATDVADTLVIDALRADANATAAETAAAVEALNALDPDASFPPAPPVEPPPVEPPVVEPPA